MPNTFLCMKGILQQLVACAMLAITTCEVRAQNEYFAGDPEWVVAATGLGFTFDCFYSIEDDTIVGGYEYKIIDASPQEATGDAEVFLNDNVWIRSENKTIWWYNTDLNQEELLYRFEGEIGDTLPMHPFLLEQPGWPAQHFVIGAVDSLLVGSEWRKRFHTSNTFIDNKVVYEGIGNNSGLFGKMRNNYDLLKCFTWENETYYPSHIGADNYLLEAGPCNFDAVAETDGAQLDVFPNPVQDRLSIHTTVSQQEFEITDISGRCMYRSASFGTRTYAVISHLSQGVYVCSVLLSDGTRHSVKFVKE